MKVLYASANHRYLLVGNLIRGDLCIRDLLLEGHLLLTMHLVEHHVCRGTIIGFDMFYDKFMTKKTVYMVQISRVAQYITDHTRVNYI